MKKTITKKGQVTIFLIIGILILAVFAGVYSLISYTQKEKLSAQEKLPSTLGIRPKIKFFVESCLREIAAPGAYLLAAQGGTLYPKDTTKLFITENKIVNYGYLNGINQLSLKNMQNDLAAYLDESLNTCIQNFSSFQKQGIKVKDTGKPKASSIIRTDNLLLKLKYPLEATLGKDTASIADFSTKLSLPLGKLVAQANNIITKQKNTPFLNLNYLTTFDAFVSVFPFDKDITLYSLSDEKAKIRGSPFTFIFAVKDNRINTAPGLNFISDEVIKQRQRFTLQLSAEDQENDALTYSSNKNKFPVSKDGLVNVTAPAPGTFFVTFTVKDTKGLKDEQKVRIVVEK